MFSRTDAMIVRRILAYIAVPLLICWALLAIWPFLWSPPTLVQQFETIETGMTLQEVEDRVGRGAELSEKDCSIILRHLLSAEKYRIVINAKDDEKTKKAVFHQLSSGRWIWRKWVEREGRQRKIIAKFVISDWRYGDSDSRATLASTIKVGY